MRYFLESFWCGDCSQYVVQLVMFEGGALCKCCKQTVTESMGTGVTFGCCSTTPWCIDRESCERTLLSSAQEVSIVREVSKLEALLEIRKDPDALYNQAIEDRRLRR